MPNSLKSILNLVARLKEHMLRHSKYLRPIGGTALALLIFTFSSKAIQDIVVFGAAIYAVYIAWRTGRGLAAWRQPAGIAFTALVLYMAFSLPFSRAPAASFRDFTGMLEIFAGAFAIPVIFNTRRRLETALLYSANAIILTLAFDLCRLTYRLGSNLMEQAHAFKPFILNHSNVASMMAGLTALVYFYFFWQWRRAKRRTAYTCLLGIAVALIYQIVLASRGPQLALALTIAVMGAFLPGTRRKIVWGLAIVCLGALLAVHSGKINPRIAPPPTSTTDTTTGAQTITARATDFLRNNLNQRDVVWKHTWSLAKQRPWFGHGYGKRNFTRIYYENDPPSSDYYYPHPHQYWLKLFFEFGWMGLLLHLAAWLILAWQLLRRIYCEPTFTARLLPGTIALMLLCIHLYGLGDYPDNLVQIVQIWLIPVALVIIAERADALYPRRHAPAPGMDVV